MKAPVTDKQLLEMMWERFPEIMKRGAEQPAPSQYGSPELQAMIVARAMENNAAEQPAQQEPVGEVGEIDIDEDGQAFAWLALHKNVDIGDKLYTSPPAQRKPLTPREYNIALALVDIKPSLYEAVTRAIEAAHGIKENT